MSRFRLRTCSGPATTELIIGGATLSIAAALDDVAVVMSCIDQPGRNLLHAAIERGLLYTDITPHLTELGCGAAYEKIDGAARTSGARVVLGTGIVPGISNVMVRAVAQMLGGAEEIETSLLLSASDAAGPASFEYFLQELSMPFVVHVDGADSPVRAFSDPRLILFPPPVGARRAYLFPFSDQVHYPRTLGARSSDTLFALRVDVTNRGQSSHATLLGHAQADAAAAGAAGVVRSLLDGEVAEPGAWMPEQVIDPGLFFSGLAAQGLRVDLAPVAPCLA